MSNLCCCCLAFNMLLPPSNTTTAGPMFHNFRVKEILALNISISASLANRAVKGLGTIFQGRHGKQVVEMMKINLGQFSTKWFSEFSSFGHLTLGMGVFRRFMGSPDC